MTHTHLLAVPVLALSALLALTGCGSSGDTTSSGAGDTTVTVFAAASLTDAFTTIAADFEEEHPGTKVALSFDGSSTLVTQLQNGAPADVFASADTTNMDNLTAAGLQGQDPQDFATNTLEIAVPPGNPAGVSSFSDLTKPGLNLVTCAPEVPCGAAAQKIAAAEGVTLQPVSEEQSVTDVLAKVTSGEADAGLVYVTDVKAAGSDVEGVTFPETTDAINTYPITTLAASKQADLAQQFVDFVLGDQGQTVLGDDGFARP